jgi:transposase
VRESAACSEPPDRPGLAGLGPRAHLVVSKYADNLPLHRQSEIYGRKAWY